MRGNLHDDDDDDDDDDHDSNDYHDHQDFNRIQKKEGEHTSIQTFRQL